MYAALPASLFTGFAALLGYNPIQTLLGSALDKLPASSQAYLSGHSFFPSLISAPFHAGLQVASAAEAAELLEAAGNPGVTSAAEVPTRVRAPWPRNIRRR